MLYSVCSHTPEVSIRERDFVLPWAAVFTKLMILLRSRPQWKLEKMKKHPLLFPYTLQALVIYHLELFLAFDHLCNEIFLTYCHCKDLIRSQTQSGMRNSHFSLIFVYFKTGK